MSVKVMSWVWDHSQSKGMDRLVLLAIADCAADDGANAYPSMAKLVAKTGLTDRGIQKCLARLVESGELVVNRNAGPRGCNRYRVRMVTPEQGSPPPNVVHPEQGSPPEPDSPPPPNDVHPTPEQGSPGTVLEPSVEPSETSSSSAKPPKAELAIPERPDVERICLYLAEWIVRNGSKRPTITKKWRTEARLLIDKDGKTLDEIREVIAWCQRDAFWRSNILSMPTLREKYDRLRLAAQRAQHTNHTTGQDIDWNAAMERAKAREGIEP